MKKILFAVVFSVFGVIPSYADSTIPPVPANSYLGGQVVASLLNHGTLFEEYQRGSRRMVLTDNVVEVGSIGGNYVGAATLSLTSDLNVEALLRLNVHSIVNRYVAYTPNWAWLKSVEYFPAVGWEFQKDHAHAWVASVNLGVGFGPGAGQ